MFGLLNEMSVSSIIDLYDKIKSFQIKLNLWMSYPNEKKTRMFAAHLKEKETGTSLNKSLFSELKVHFLSLKDEPSRYFPNMLNTFLWSNHHSHLTLFIE
jgi:hypothetical protein